MINRPSIAGRLAVSALMSLVLPTACWAQALEGSNSLFQKFGQLRWNATNHATDPIQVAGYSNSSAFNANPNSLNGFSDYNSSDSPFTTSGPIMYVGNYGSTFTELSATALNLQGGAPSLGNINTAFGAVVGTGFDMGALAVLDTALTTFTASNANLASQTAEVQDTIRIINAGVYPAGGFADAAAAQVGLTDSFNTLSTAAIALGAGADTSEQAVEVNDIDRNADDINGNGNPGVISVISTVNGVQTVVGQIIDTGNLYTFNVFFDTVYVRQEQTFTSFEVMKQHVFYASPSQNTATTGWRFDAFWDDWALGLGEEVRGNHPITLERVELFSHDLLSHDWLCDAIDATQWSTYGTAGFRGMRIEDDFFFDGRGSILGRTSVATMIDHDIFGPQLGVGVVAEASMFRFEALLLGLVGYGNAETKQVGIFGEELIPGALNRPATARATMSAQKTDEDFFAWHGETRITGSCQLTQNLRFDATWRGILAGPVRSAADATVWSAPDFGIANLNGDTVDLSHWFFGLTYTH